MLLQVSGGGRLRADRTADNVMTEIYRATGQGIGLVFLLFAVLGGDDTGGQAPGSVRGAGR